MELSSVIGPVAAAVLTPLVLRQVSAARQPARTQGDDRVLEFGVGYQALMLVTCVVFTSFAMLAWRFPGRTDPKHLPWVILLFLSFALCGLVSLVWMGRGAVFWNDVEVQGADTWGRRGRLAWNELASAEYVGWAQCVRLKSGRGVALWVSPSMRGYEEFQSKLEDVCAEHEIPAPELPFSGF